MQRALLGLALLALGLIAATALLRPDGNRTIAPERIHAEAGHAYVVALHRLYRFPYRVRPFEQTRDRRSPLQITEAGRPLGPGDAPHLEIRTAGGGAFSHWGKTLYFSTTDLSDPRSNGRLYAVSAPIEMHPLWLWGWLAIGGAALLGAWTAGGDQPLDTIGRVRRMLRGLAAVAAVLAFAALLLQGASVRLQEPLRGEQLSQLEGNLYYRPLPYILAPFIEVDSQALRLDVNGESVACRSGTNARTEGAPGCAYDGIHLYLAVADAPARGPAAPLTEWSATISYPIRVHPALSAGLILLALLLAVLARQARVRDGYRIIATAMTLLGLLLLTLNLYGLTQPLRHPRLHELAGAFDPIDLTLDYRSALARLHKGPAEDPEVYVARATLAVADAVLHRWQQPDFDTYRVHLPIWENWVLHLLGLIDPQLRAYIFWDHRRGLERGLGECGHVASILVGFLRTAGIDARMVTLQGHVVVTAEVRDGRWHLLDPDLGLVIPADLDSAIAQPALLASAYAARLQETAMTAAQQAAFARRLVDYYLDHESNRIDPTGRLSYYVGMASPPQWYAEREALAYRLKWGLPILFLWVATLTRRRAWGG